MKHTDLFLLHTSVRQVALFLSSIWPVLIILFRPIDFEGWGKLAGYFEQKLEWKIYIGDMRDQKRSSAVRKGLFRNTDEGMVSTFKKYSYYYEVSTLNGTNIDKMIIEMYGQR